MWQLQPEAEYQKRARKWPRKHQREYDAAHDNLDTYFKSLQAGAVIEQIKFGFIHREPRGIVAVDQKGGGTGLKETRIYTYPNRISRILHVITMGDKNTQKGDIRYACEFVESLQLPNNQAPHTNG